MRAGGAAGRATPSSGGGEAGDAGPPLPLYRVADGRRVGHRRRRRRPQRRPVDPSASAARARLEGGAAQVVGPQVALGRGGFADDRAPPDALVALRRTDGEWVIGESLAEARALSGKVQGRRTTLPLTWPFEVPPGDWVAHAADELGRTRVPRARRVVVRAGRRAGQPARQRRGVRRQGRLRRRLASPASWPTGTAVRCA